MDYTKIDFNKWQPFSAWVDGTIEKQAEKVNENRYPKPNLNSRQTQIYKESLLSQIQHLKKIIETIK